MNEFSGNLVLMYIPTKFHRDPRKSAHIRALKNLAGHNH